MVERHHADLRALAERCEMAEGPDRALDFMILKRVRGLRDLGSGLYEMDNHYYALEDDDPDERHPPFPRVTASVDRALGLVPSGFSVRMGTRGWAEIIRSQPHRFISTHAATLPLALCAAALRVRATEQDTPDAPR